ncbi:MAG: cache domain-containing protein [Syntrophobacteraceae bacterium]
MRVEETLDVRKRLREAVVFYETAGKVAMIKEIDNLNGQFAGDGCYLFAVDLEGNMLAHPMDKFKGRNLMDLRDSLGKSFIRKIVDTAKARGGGSTEYEWPMPGGEIEGRKTTLFERVGDFVLCCGFFSSDEPSLESHYERLFGPLE